MQQNSDILTKAELLCYHRCVSTRRATWYIEKLGKLSWDLPVIRPLCFREAKTFVTGKTFFSSELLIFRASNAFLALIQE